MDSILDFRRGLGGGHSSRMFLFLVHNSDGCDPGEGHGKGFGVSCGRHRVAQALRLLLKSKLS